MSGSFAGLSLDVSRVMGVVNVTPDSFSDGGDAFAPEAAVERGRELIALGADILDIGGESTRPGASSVSVDEEIGRVVPVISELKKLGSLLSIDTRHAEVMKAAVFAGVDIINDVSALEGDPEALTAASELGVPVILMHMRGQPDTMQHDPRYDDAAGEVRDYLIERVQACLKAGIPADHIAVDPGIGFGKTAEHNLQILNRIDEIVGTGRPVVLGVSRKSFIGKIAGEEDPKRRLPGSIAAALAAHAKGVRIFRVHDVGETVQALKVSDAIRREGV